MARRIFISVALIASACGTQPVGTFDSIAPDTTEAVAESSTTTTIEQESEPTQSTTSAANAEALGVPSELADFSFDTILLDGVELHVAVAATTDHRRQGLMNLTDLRGLDGMLFVFDQDATGGFWMKDTLIPLDIAFFDADGMFVDGFEMPPCTTEDCPTYRPSGPYLYALEMPAGDMPDEVRQFEYAEERAG